MNFTAFLSGNLKSFVIILYYYVIMYFSIYQYSFTLMSGIGGIAIVIRYTSR